MTDADDSASLTPQMPSVGRPGFLKISKFSDPAFWPRLPATSSDRALRPRLPTTPSGHAFQLASRAEIKLLCSNFARRSAPQHVMSFPDSTFKLNKPRGDPATVESGPPNCKIMLGAWVGAHKDMQSYLGLPWDWDFFSTPV